MPCRAIPVILNPHEEVGIDLTCSVDCYCPLVAYRLRVAQLKADQNQDDIHSQAGKELVGTNKSKQTPFCYYKQVHA